MNDCLPSLRLSCSYLCIVRCATLPWGGGGRDVRGGVKLSSLSLYLSVSVSHLSLGYQNVSVSLPLSHPEVEEVPHERGLPGVHVPHHHQVQEALLVPAQTSVLRQNVHRLVPDPVCACVCLGGS